MEVPELPDELWRNIFDRLDDREFCKTVPRVCRRWNGLARDLRGTCVTLTSIDDIRAAAKLPKIYVVHLKTVNYCPSMGTAELAPIKDLLEGAGNIFSLSMAMDVFMKAACLFVYGRVQLSRDQCDAFRMFQLRVLGGTIELYVPPIRQGISRNGDLVHNFVVRIDLPALITPWAPEARDVDVEDEPAAAAPPRRVKKKGYRPHPERMRDAYPPRHRK